MKDWLASAGFALVALVLFWALLFPKPQSLREQSARPVSSETAGAGLVAVGRWLKSANVPSIAWRRRFGGLQAASPVPTGNLMITFMPHAMPIRSDEQQALDKWVAKGNALLVMTALADTPNWSAQSVPFGLDSQLQRLTRLKFTVVNPPKDDTDRTRAAAELAFAPPKVSIVPVATPAGVHPLLAGVTTLETHSDLPASRWQAAPMDISPVLEIARRADTDDTALWLKPFGKGTVIVSAFASPLSNAGLREPGNARWFANVANFVLGPGGAVFLDDAHQGVTDDYDPRAFFKDPRLHATLWWIVGVWLAFVLLSRHLPAAAGRAPVDDSAMVRLTGDFYATAVTPLDAGRRLFEHFFNALRRRQGMPEDGAPLWDWLAGHARVSAVQLGELRALHATLARGRKVDLPRLQALLSAVSGQLA